MESELSQAYYGVYCSSKEILKNNQRHLYCSVRRQFFSSSFFTSSTFLSRLHKKNFFESVNDFFLLNYIVLFTNVGIFLFLLVNADVGFIDKHLQDNRFSGQ